MNLESIVKKLFLGGTAVVAVAVSLMAAESFAVSATGTTAASGVTGSTTFSLTVEKVLTLSSVSATSGTGAASIEASPSSVVEDGKLSATVQTNTAYTISLKADNPALRLNGTDNTNTIPAASTLTAGTNGWGIKKSGESGYTALTTSNVAFLSNGAAAPSGATTNFTIGVAIAPTLKDGSYSTPVTVTAAVK